MHLEISVNISCIVPKDDHLKSKKSFILGKKKKKVPFLNPEKTEFSSGNVQCSVCHCSEF